MVERTFFTDGRRAAISGWALNLSVVFLSSVLISEAFFTLSTALRIVVIVWGVILMVLGVLVAPPKEGGS